MSTNTDSIVLASGAGSKKRTEITRGVRRSQRLLALANEVKTAQGDEDHGTSEPLRSSASERVPRALPAPVPQDLVIAGAAQDETVVPDTAQTPSVLGKRDLVLRNNREVTQPMTTAYTEPRVALAPGVVLPQPVLLNDHEGTQRAGNLVLTEPFSQLMSVISEMEPLSDADARVYGNEQLNRWLNTPNSLITPPDVVYDQSEQGFDMEAWVRAAFRTGQHLTTQNSAQTREGAWVQVLQAQRRRLPSISDPSAVMISPMLLSPLACVALLQTMLLEAGFEFINVIPIWENLQAVSGVSESQIWSGVEESRNRLGEECREWRRLMRNVSYHVRQRMEPLPEIPPPIEYHPTDEDGDLLMSEDAAQYLGKELVLRLRVTGTRGRSPTSSDLSEPKAKRPQFTTPEVAPALAESLPSWHPSTDTSGRDDSMGPGSDSIPSLVGPNSASEASMATADVAMDLSGLSSSGSSLMSTTDYRGGNHMPGPGLGAMVMMAQGGTRDLSSHASTIGYPIPVAPYPQLNAVNMNRLATSANPALQQLPDSPEPDGSDPSDQSSSNRSPRGSKSSRKSSRQSEKSERSGRSSASRTSSRSRTAELALSMMRQQEVVLKQTREEMTAQLRLMQQQFQAENAEQRARLEVEMLRNEELRKAEEEARVRAEHQAQEEAEKTALQAKIRAELHHSEKIRKAEEEARKRAERKALEKANKRNKAKKIHTQSATQLPSEKLPPNPDSAQILRLQAEFEAQLKAMQAEFEREREEMQKAKLQQDERLRVLAATQSVWKPAAQSANTSRPVATSPGSTPQAGPKGKSAPVMSRSQVNADQLHAAQLEASLQSSKGKSLSAKGAATSKPTGVTTPMKDDKSKNRSDSASITGAETTRGRSRKSDQKNPKSRTKTKSSRVQESSSSDSSDDSEKGDDDCSSDSESDWEKDLDEELNAGLKTGANVGVGGIPFRPYIHYNAIEVFDENAILENRVNWWERFSYAAALGMWPGKMKIRQLRGRLSAPLRDWYIQLPERVRHNWDQLSRAFRKEYCRVVGSPYERYYMLKLREDETPRAFLYRLNAAAIKADVKFLKPAADRELHVRRFIKKLKDQRLKTTLQGQEFTSISQLERTLKRVEAVQREDGYETPPTKTRESRSANLQFGRYKSPRKPEGGRVFLALGDSSDSESERHVRFSSPGEAAIETVSAHQAPASVNPTTMTTAVPPVDNATRALTTEDVYRVVEQLSWRPAQHSGSAPPSPRRENPHKNIFCERCQRFGHAPEDCWVNMKCDRCGELGHPARVCKRRACAKCGDFHREGLCEDLTALKAMKELARSGGLQDLPAEIRQQLLRGETISPGASSNN